MSDESEDDLDKFMAGIEKQLMTERSNLSTGENPKNKGQRVDIEEENEEESYLRYLSEQLATTTEQDEVDELDYDSDGYPIAPKKKEIVPLPLVDHSKMSYKAFKKDFYSEHVDLGSLSKEEIDSLRKSFGIKVYGIDVVKPGISFAHFGFDHNLIEVVRNHGYHTPTPIQSQAISIAMNGRDIVGIAKTGSGKTAAYLLPMMVHVIDQPELKEGDGPIGLICAPTRELCQQIYEEAKKFAKAYNLHVVAAYGGGNKYAQSKALKEGAEIVVATPGRLIDLIKENATDLLRVTYLVFDEADRMFDMGFGPQVKSVIRNTRPDKQCLLFSATFKKKVEKLCREFLKDPIKIVVGDMGEANEDILQIAHYFNDTVDKWKWLTRNIVEFTSSGNVLIFVTKKSNSEILAKELSDVGYDVGLIHGDFNQFDRDKVMDQFKKSLTKILVATDVAARGIDIRSIHTVVNYDVARDINTHIHRIGRTGRAGEKGIAYTLITKSDSSFIPDFVRHMENSNQKVPSEVMDIAMKNPWFRSHRQKFGKKTTVNQSILEDNFSSGVQSKPGFGFVPQTNAISKDATVYNNPTNTSKDRLSNLKKTYQRDFNKFQRSTTHSSVVEDKELKKSRWN